MQTYQREFIEFALDQGALRFGSFTLKSGRHSPYFFNSGLFSTGTSLFRLASFYARAIQAARTEFDMIYGPAYKGIPLVSAVAIAFSELFERDLPYCFNRKEVKAHGEGGRTVGAPLHGKVLIVDDVISAGTSIRESVDIIDAAGAQAVAVAISLDRQERGDQGASAIEEVERAFRLTVISVAKLSHLIEYLHTVGGMDSQLEQLREYSTRYGA